MTKRPQRRVIPSDPCAIWFDRARAAEAEVERLRAERDAYLAYYGAVLVAQDILRNALEKL